MRNRNEYPADWPELARACKERAGWICQHCRIKHGSWRKSKRTGRRYRAWLQAAHVNHLDRPKSNAELLCLCFRCHARYDYQHNQRIADIRLNSLKHRHLLSKRGY
jgi:hypothetical protein